MVPPPALIYTEYQAPLDTEYDSSDVSGQKGTASTVCILGLVSVGDASARAAAADGGISIVDHADYSFLNVLGVFSMYTTIVYGH